MHKGKLSRALFFLSLILVLLFSFSFRRVSLPEENLPEIAFKKFLTSNAVSLVTLMQEMDELSSAKLKKQDYDELKSKFNSARNQYKGIETFIIHFFPGDALALNTQDLPYPEEDDEVSILLEPHGFRVLERLIYLDSTASATKHRKNEIARMLRIMEKWPESIRSMDFPEREIFEAAQQGMIRLFLVGLTNIETPFARNAFPEAEAYISSLQVVLSEMYAGDSLWVESLQRELFPVFDWLRIFLGEQEKLAQPDFYSLYSSYYIPASEELVKVRQYLLRNNFYQTTAVNLQMRSIFDPGAFNTYFFLPGKSQMRQQQVADLGRILFFDPVLSSNNERACASCHQPALAFTDGLAVSQSFKKEVMLSRNAPSLINAVLQRKLFHDGRSFSFENQASEVLNNPDEMHANFSEVAMKLKNSSEYKKLFIDAFQDTQDTAITGRSILMAIAEYERSLIALNSRFDRSIRGQEDLLSPDEKTGFNLAVGKGNCASCHFIPLFNGALPPDYAESEMEVLGVPGNADLNHPVLDKDPGREAIIPMGMYKGSFKTPSLRNVELTGPYMHNGVFRTLEEVLEFYNRGGGEGIGLDVPNQTLLPDSLRLTDREKKQIILFLKSLTDTAFTGQIPTHLPFFENNAELNSRNIGGEY